MRLEGRHAVVTGAASGLGEATARRLAEEGASVSCMDLNAEAAEAVAASLAKARAFAVDVGSEESIQQALAAATDTFGVADILVNSAGVGMQRAALKTTAEDFERIYRINVIGSFILCRDIAQQQIDAGKPGSLINIASVSGLRGSAGRSAYGASKAAVINMSQVMATELARHGIRVNAIAPGPVETAMTREVHDAKVRATWAQSVPTGVYGTPEDIAGAAAYLASDDARNVYGQVIAVDGGFAAAGLIFDVD